MEMQCLWLSRAALAPFPVLATRTLEEECPQCWLSTHVEPHTVSLGSMGPAGGLCCPWEGPYSNRAPCLPGAVFSCGST